MTFETYWLAIAPAALLAVSGIGWAALWMTRHRASPDQAKSLR